MSGLVSYATINSWRTRQPFKSVGLVCGCGNAVSGYEGTLVRCVECGCVYAVTVMIVGTGERDTAVDTASPAAITDGPEPDPSQPIADESGVPLAEPHRHDLDVMGHA